MNASPSTRPLGAPAALAVVEVTPRAVAMGVIFGALFGAANAYLGLRVGMTVATSIPVSVMTVAALRLTGSRATILEANLSQTIGSASTALATGAIFTLPALYLWGAPPSFLQIAGLTLCGGILGVTAMVPLRRLLIVRSAAELPYPEGRACAEVLKATTAGTSSGAWIFRGLLIGVCAKLALDLGRLVPSEVTAQLPGLPRGELALEIAPALVGVGFILGARQSAVCVSGGVISALVITPLVAVVLAKSGQVVPDATTIWKEWVRYVGTGAVALAGLVTVARGLPAMTQAFMSVARGLADDEAPTGGSGARPGAAAAGGADPGAAGAAAAELAETRRKSRDVPGWVVAAGVITVIVALALIPGLLAGDRPIGERVVTALGVGVLGLVFVAVASRIVGLVGVSSQPTSGICLVTLLGLGAVFYALGWTGSGAKLLLLTAGTVVAVAASKAGDISQDLKTGQLVGATPARQQAGQLLGAVTACGAVAATIVFLGTTSTFGSKDLPAPQATLMKTVIEGLLDGTLPWPLVLAGAGLALAAMLGGVSGLAFAIGVYLPLGAMTPLLVGGLARRLADGPGPGAGHEGAHDGGGTAGVLAASGLVAGEGLAGVVIAVLVGAGGVHRPSAPLLGGLGGAGLALALVGVTFGFLLVAGRRTPNR